MDPIGDAGGGWLFFSQARDAMILPHCAEERTQRVWQGIVSHKLSGNAVPSLA
jgi:hypothetical protein